MPVGGKAAGGVPGVKKGRAGFEHFKSRPVAFMALWPLAVPLAIGVKLASPPPVGGFSGAGAGRRLALVVVGARRELLALTVVVDEGHL